MAVCIVAGTSTNAEPTWPSVLGATSTDGPVQWKRIWELGGRTKGSLRGQVSRDHIQYTTADPSTDGFAGNQWGFPLRGSLLIGGVYPTYYAPVLTLNVYAMTTSTQTSLIHTQNMTDRTIQRLPKGAKSDEWEFRLTGTLNVRFFRVAEVASEIGATG